MRARKTFSAGELEAMQLPTVWRRFRVWLRPLSAPAKKIRRKRPLATPDGGDDLLVLRAAFVTPSASS
jgi:hypothetical protein